MFKTKQTLLNTSLILVVLMLLSACGGNIIKPIRKDVIGQSTVRNVTVVTVGSAQSATISPRVKKAIIKEGQNELRGNKTVDLKITIDKWAGTETTLGGSVTNTLFGSKTYLNGVVDVLDTNTGGIIGKYTIFSEYKEGGLFGGKMTTVSFTDVDQTVIDNFAMYTINHLE